MCVSIYIRCVCERNDIRLMSLINVSKLRVSITSEFNGDLSSMRTYAHIGVFTYTFITRYNIVVL